MSVFEVVAREARRATRAVRIAEIALPAGVAAALLTAGAMWLARGRWLDLPAILPFAVWFVALVGAAVIAQRVQHRFASRARPAAIAEAIEDEQRLRRGALTGLLEVAGAGGAFVDRAAEKIGASLRDVSEVPAPAHRKQMRRVAFLSAFVLAQVLLLASTSWARRPDGWRALLSPVAAWRGTLLPALTLAEAPRVLPRGASATFGVQAEGRRAVTMHWRLTGGAWRDSLVTVDGSGRASLTLAVVDADLAFVAGDGRSLSDTALVRVVDRPFLGDVTVRATYPAYLARTTERLAADAPIRIPAGTRLVIDGHASEELAAVQLTGPTRIALTTEGTTFSGAMTPRASGSWTWTARGTQSEIADLPTALEIEVLEDSVPHVEILEPTGEVLAGAGDRVGIEILAQDDHALSGVWLRRWIVHPDGKATEPVEVRLSDAREGEWLGGVIQELAGLDLDAGAPRALRRGGPRRGAGSARGAEPSARAAHPDHE